MGVSDPRSMSNAQAALIAASAAKPNGTVNEIRAMAAEFAVILDNVDKQDQAGSVPKREE